MNCWRVASTAVLMCGSIGAAQRPSTPNMGVTLGDGTTLRFSTISDRGSTQMFSAGAISASSDRAGGVFHRLLVDLSGAVFFGYDMQLRHDAGDGAFTLRIVPLSGELARTVAETSRAPIATFNKSWEVRHVRAGDRTQVDVLIDPKTGEKITDVIEIDARPADMAPAVQDTATTARAIDRLVVTFPTGQPRPSLPVTDATLTTIKWVRFRVTLDGKRLAEFPGGNAAGRFLWVYLPGHGAWVFSADEPRGHSFRRVAVVQGNRVRVDLEGEVLEVESEAPVLPSGGNSLLWVLRDPSYRPPRSPLGGQSYDRLGGWVPSPDSVLFGAGDFVPLPHPTAVQPKRPEG